MDQYGRVESVIYRATGCSDDYKHFKFLQNALIFDFLAILNT